ncbi:hypothetical protein C4J85_2651 [Pseudomonas sp. R4-34-07]|nr:hypothetical protein C4J85_2651 [Pseudomonas sp. R4-34-07]
MESTLRAECQGATGTGDNFRGALQMNLTPHAASRLDGQLKHEVLGPAGLSRSTTTNTTLNFAPHFQRRMRV